jgi:hypothetical protein
MSEWWLVEEPEDLTSWLTIGPYTVPLNHLKFGNDKTLNTRQITRRDIILCQRTWPRHRIMNFVFTNLLRNAKVPRNSNEPCVVYDPNFPSRRVQQYLCDYPGQTATLMVPEPTNPVKELRSVTYFGVITDHTLSELADDKVELSLTLDIFKEYFPEGAMRLQ